MFYQCVPGFSLGSLFPLQLFVCLYVLCPRKWASISLKVNFHALPSCLSVLRNHFEPVEDKALTKIL